MINRGSNGSRNPCQADLSYAARSILIQNEIRIIQKCYVDLWSIGVYRHAIVSQVVVERLSGLRIVVGFFKERHTDAHHDCTLDLIASRIPKSDYRTPKDGFETYDAGRAGARPYRLSTRTTRVHRPARGS